MLILGANLTGAETTSAQFKIGPEENPHFTLTVILDGEKLKKDSVFQDFDLEANHQVGIELIVGNSRLRVLELDIEIYYVGQTIFSLELTPEDFGLGAAVTLEAKSVISEPPSRFNIARLADDYGVPLPLNRIVVGRFQLGFTILYEVEIGTTAFQAASKTTASTLAWAQFERTFDFDVVIPAEPQDFITTVPGAVGTTSGVVTVALAGKSAATGATSSINPAPRSAGMGLSAGSPVAPTQAGLDFARLGERMPAAARASATRRITNATKRRFAGHRCPKCGVAWPKDTNEFDALEICPGCENSIAQITEPMTRRIRNLATRSLGLLATLGIIPIYELASNLDVSDLEAIEVSEVLEEAEMVQGSAISVKGVTGSMAKASIPAIITTFFYAQLTGLAAMDLVETILISIASIVGFTLLGMLISKLRKPKLPEDVKAELQAKAAATESLEEKTSEMEEDQEADEMVSTEDVESSDS